MEINFKQLKEIIELINKGEINKFELKTDKIEFKMSKEAQIIDLNTLVVNREKTTEKRHIDEKFEKNIQNTNNTIENNNEIDEAYEDQDLVKSPIVGTFYDSPNPEAPPFVKVGDKVKEGDILCIIEAMKIMNEIKAPFDGEIVKILLENEDIVEYNQPIMVMRK